MSTEQTPAAKPTTPVLRRVLHRYRRQLRPLWAALTLLVAGAMAYEAQNGLRAALVVSVLAVAGIAIYAHRRLDRPVERRYAVVVAAAAGMWACAVAWDGVSSLALVVLLGGTLAAAAPWWWHVRVRRGPRKPPPSTATSEAAQVWAEHVAGAGQALPGSQLTGVRPEGDGGWTATIILPRGSSTTETAIAATEKVTSAYELPIGAVAIERTDDGIASHARITVMPSNPLQAGALFTGPTLDRETGTAEIGVHMDGKPAKFAFWIPGSGGVHTLVSGSTGSGKSRFLEQVLAEARHSGLITTWLVDPQGGQSLPRWIDRVDWSARSAEDGLALIDAAVRVMHARSRHLARKSWTDHKGRTIAGVDHFEPSPEMPLLQLVIEEAPDVLRAYPEAVEKLASIGKMGRKCGVSIVLALQKPSVDELGGSSTLRSMASSGNVVCFRTSDKVSAGMAFAGNLPGDPSAIPRYFPNGSATGGMGYVVGPGSRAAVMRAYYLDDPYEWAHSGSSAVLDALSARAAGAGYADRQHPTDAAQVPAPVTGGSDEDDVPGEVVSLSGAVPEVDVDVEDEGGETWSVEAPDYDDVATIEPADVDELADAEPALAAPADVDEDELPGGLTPRQVVLTLLGRVSETGQEVASSEVTWAAQRLEREEYRYKPHVVAATLRELREAGEVENVRQGYWRLTGGDLR